MLTKHYNLLTRQIKENQFDFLQFDHSKIKEFCSQSSEILSKYRYIVIIGMGASALNLKAVCSSANLIKNVIYLDSLHILEIEEKLSVINLTEAVFFSISKSGNTHETLTITEYLIQTKRINPKSFYVISPTNDNLLYNLATRSHLNHLKHDVHGSGRFNIISGATLLPALHLGVAIEKIISGARKALDKFLIDGGEVLPKATWYLDNYKLHRTILVMFNYSYHLNGFLQWRRQMLGESLGKNDFGITPIIADGTFDQHSQLQLYLDGPDNKFYEIIQEANIKDDLLSKALAFHYDNVYKTFVAEDKPVKLETISVNEETIGGNIIETMLVIMLIASYQNINPFDQPSVDRCKIK